MTAMSTPAAGALRRRLPPEVRVRQILDAALQEFSVSGYANTRMDDIAQRAQISKGGLYGHFVSKEEVLAALLDHGLRPIPIEPEHLMDGVASARELAERLVDHLHRILSQAELLTAFRLLLAESQRVPELIARWQQDAIGQEASLKRLLALAAERGLCRPAAVNKHPWLLLSPVVHAILISILAGKPPEPLRRQWREGHIELVCALLEPA